VQNREKKGEILKLKARNYRR